MKGAALALLFAVVTCGRADARPVQAEAWRMGAHLVAHDGHAYDVAVDFFRYGAPGGAATVYPATASVIDESGPREYAGRRIDRAAFGASAIEGPAIHVGDWSLVREQRMQKKAAFVLAVSAGAASLTLHLLATKPAVDFDFGAGPHRAYTSLSCSGSVEIDGQRYALTGKGWLDRIRGDDATAPVRGVRNDFVVQLDDGREIVVQSAGVTARGAVPQAVLVDTNGSLERLSPQRYFFGGRNVWHSTHTTNDYPDQWGIYVPDVTQILLFEPILIDQEVPAHGFGTTFYEAAYDVFDYTPGSIGARLGSAFGLLRGYDHTEAMR